MGKFIKSTSIMLMCCLILTSLLMIPQNVYSESKPSLILIENPIGKWTAYNDMSVTSATGCLMVKISEFCDAIGLDYASANSKNQFTIFLTDKIKNVYSIGKKEYNFYPASGKKTTKTAKDAASYDKTMKTWLCDANTLSALCFMKVFDTSGTAYVNTPYYSVLCFSRTGSISKLPDIKKISYENGDPLYVSGDIYKSPDGKWQTTMSYIDGSINGKRGSYYLSQGQNLDTHQSYITIDSNHNATLSKKYSFHIETGKDAVQGLTYTKETIGTNTVMPEIVVWGEFSGESLESDAIKEAVIRLDKLDRNEGTVAGYVKITGVAGDNNIVSLEGYFADNLINHSKDKDAQIYNKLKDARTGGSIGSAGSSGTGGVSGSNGSAGSILKPKLTTVTCTACGGSGKIRCSACNGVGYKTHMGYRYGVYGEIVDACLVCGGAGASICSVCGGMGSITKITTP